MLVPGGRLSRNLRYWTEAHPSGVEPARSAINLGRREDGAVRRLDHRDRPEVRRGLGRASP
jgi:hypothetical protein